jgi:hypothetical protein
MSEETIHKYATPGDVNIIVGKMEDQLRIRSRNRAIINSQFNGMRPYTDAEVEANQIQVNVNFLEGYKTAVDANLQVNGALLNKPYFFTARCTAGPPEKREEWGRIFTEQMNKPMMRGKSGKKHYFLMRNRNAALVLHGIGAMVWHDPEGWMPKFVALDDLLIPTDTPQEFSDELCHFGVNVFMTPYQLYKATKDSPKGSGWNMEVVNSILKGLRNVNYFTPDLWDQPERLESMWKQHAAYMDSDSVPKVKLTYFYHQDNESGKWFRKIIVRENGALNFTVPDKFVYDDGNRPFADDIDQIIHVQYGDGNVVAPLKFHSVRGLGMLLFSVVEMMNRLRCQEAQHTFEQMMALYRLTSPADKDRPKVVQLQPHAVLPEGLSVVGPNERHQADPRMVDSTMSKAKQIMSESSSSYVQDIDTGTRREQTLGEAQIKLQSANKIIAGMLGTMYLQEGFYYDEVKRRFLNPSSTDKQVVAFRKACIAQGIPEALLKPELWVLDIEKMLGAGDQTLAIQEATQLLSVSNRLDPSAQRLVLRKYIATITRNPDLANILVPDNPDEASDGRIAAEAAFPTLMLGIPVALREGIEQQDYIVTMLSMMATVIDGIKQTDEVGKPEQVIGLQTAAQDVEQHIGIMEQNVENKEFTGAANKALSKMMNDVRAFAQRQQQAAEAEAAKEQDGALMEQQAKTQATIAQAEASIKIKEAEAEQKLNIREAEHAQEMKQMQEKHAAEMAALAQKVAVDTAVKLEKAKQKPKPAENAG